MTPTTAIELAESVVEDGFGAHRAALAALAAGARRQGVSDVLVTIAVDPTEPRAVRERALGKIVARYANACEAGPDPVRPELAA